MAWFLSIYTIWAPFGLELGIALRYQFRFRANNPALPVVPIYFAFALIGLHLALIIAQIVVILQAYSYSYGYYSGVATIGLFAGNCVISVAIASIFIGILVYMGNKPWTVDVAPLVTHTYVPQGQYVSVDTGYPQQQQTFMPSQYPQQQQYPQQGYPQYTAYAQAPQ